jgi:hypothetical protein
MQQLMRQEGLLQAANTFSSCDSIFFVPAFFSRDAP